MVVAAAQKLRHGLANASFRPHKSKEVPEVLVISQPIQRLRPSRDKEQTMAAAWRSRRATWETPEPCASHYLQQKEHPAQFGTKCANAKDDAVASVRRVEASIEYLRDNRSVDMMGVTE